MLVEEFGKIPPHDIGAEQATIASLMLLGDDRETFAKARRVLWREAFYQTDHQIILDVLDSLYSSKKPIDPVTVRAELSIRVLLDEIGGTAYIGTLLGCVPSAAHAVHYATIVAARAMEREAIKTANELSRRLHSPLMCDDARGYIQRAADRLSKLANIGRDVSIWKLSDAIDRFMETRKEGNSAWIETGIGALDGDFQGVLRDGGYTLVAARPSMGKSTFVRDLLRRQAKTGTRCGLISVEETQDKIAGNYLSAESNVENNRVAYEYTHWANWEHEEIGLAIDRLREIPIVGTDVAFSVNDIMAAAEAMVSQHKCRIVAVDHIHLITGSRAENREQQISEISGALKEFFKRRNVAGVVAAQLNRPEKSLCPPPPALTDLRGSGALEEHIDAALMLHREDYYYRGRDGYEPNGLCQVLIRKNRNGCVGDIVMKADLAHQRFEEQAEPIPTFD